MKLKPIADLMPWKVSAVWPMCGQCYWVGTPVFNISVPCEVCAEKYRLTDKFYTTGGEAGQ